MAVRRAVGTEPAVVCLHGFSLHGGMFATLARDLANEVVAPDLPGHGATAITPIDLATTVSALTTLLERTGPLPVLGYSQGGRIALHLALHAPNLVSQLILVSTSAGLSGEAREERRRTDEERAGRIERIGIDRFVDEWLSHPLVDTRRARPAAAARDRALRLENTAEGLAAALRGLGQGSLPAVDPANVDAPITWVVGELDTRYSRAAHRHEEAGHGTVATVPGVGHNLVLEAPAALARIVEARLRNGSSPRR